MKCNAKRSNDLIFSDIKRIMLPKLINISPGLPTERQGVWLSSDGQMAASMSIFYVDMGKTVINEVFSRLDDMTSNNPTLPLNEIWSDIQTSVGEMMINFRITIVDTRGESVDVASNSEESLIGLIRCGEDASFELLSKVPDRNSFDQARLIIGAGEINIVYLRERVVDLLSCDDPTEMQTIVGNAVSQGEWSAIIISI
jgi:hypothetical protein